MRRALAVLLALRGTQRIVDFAAVQEAVTVCTANGTFAAVDRAVVICGGIAGGGTFGWARRADGAPLWVGGRGRQQLADRRHKGWQISRFAA